ncbi:MAG: radical SAM protein [Kiritimatiellia bacterium]
MKYKHALALNPYTRDSTATMGIFPATGLEYIATNMKGLVGRVTLLDLRYEPEYQDPGALSDFIRKEIDLLCISVTWGSQFAAVCDLISRLPAEVTTIVGGNKATAEVETIFERCPNVDIVVRGEGEDTIKDIVNGLPLADIPGLSYRKGGQIVHNANRQLPDVLQIPFPDRSLRRHSYRWMQNGVRVTGLTFDTVLASRGCPFNCKFCTFSLNPLGQKRKYVERPLDSVMEEIRSITADVIMFSDDNFFNNPGRSKDLCDRIVAEGIRKSFIVQTRIEIARDEELLQKAQAAGFKIFLIGIESPHDKILKHFNKGFNQSQIRAAFKVLNKYDFFIHGYFIYGNIGETEEEMLYIARFGRELNLDTISFQKLRVDKYSPLKEVIENTPGYHYTATHGSVYSDTYSIKDLKRIRNKIRGRFYTLPQVGRMFRKIYRLHMVPDSEWLRIFALLPLVLLNAAKKELKKIIRPKKH